MSNPLPYVAGFTYLLRNGNRYKIGASGNPQSRLLIVGGPGAVLLHTIPSHRPFRIESALHRRFASVRADGPGREWFYLSDSDVEAICRVGRVDTIKELPESLRPVVSPKLTRRERYKARREALAAYLDKLRHSAV